MYGQCSLNDHGFTLNTPDVSLILTFWSCSLVFYACVFSQVPHVNRTDYQLIDISEDGFVSYLLCFSNEIQFMYPIKCLMQSSGGPISFVRSCASFESEGMPRLSCNFTTFVLSLVFDC